MPRYLLETPATTRIERARASFTASRRYPEVAIEQCFLVRDRAGSCEMWVCVAPNEAHLRRWAEASGLALATLRRVDARATELDFSQSTATEEMA
jgi:hypothetical protein